MLILAFTVANVKAQESEVKVKQTSSPTQKVHNVFSKNKRHNGYKVKHKRNGHKAKGEIKKGEVEIKSHSMVMRKEELVA